jgi:hypothetical protein
MPSRQGVAGQARGCFSYSLSLAKPTHDTRHELGAFLYMTKVVIPPRTMRWLLCMVAIAAVLSARPAAAQVRGLVVDRSERPVAGALVELWIASRRAAAAQTDNQGGFEIAGGPGQEQLMLTVRRLGMATQTLQLTSRDTTLRVVMDVQPVSLQPLTVETSAGRLCPRREEPRARELWTLMRSRYWQPNEDSVFMFAFMELRSGTGHKSDAYDPEAGRTAAGWTTGALVVAHPEFMVHSGYAAAAAGGVGDRTAFWLYRKLDQGAIQDFTGEYFGAVHTFAIISQNAGQTTIAFCPQDRLRRTGQIQGTLTLRSDTTLSTAQWSFRTPSPEEDAGGEASYLPPERAFGRALLTRETVFWRKSGPHFYYFEAKSFSGWRRWVRGPAGQPVLLP